MHVGAEKEVFEIIRENLRLGAEAAREIATQERSGLQYMRLRHHLKETEDACRQAMWFREDARWSEISLKFEQCHQVARRWLDPATVKSKKVFAALSDALGWLLTYCERLWTMRTNRIGIIADIDRPVTHVPQGPSLKNMIIQGTA